MSSTLEEVLGKKWALSLLRLLEDEEELNFSTIEEVLGISSSTLTETKDLLLACGLIEKNEIKRTDIRYGLTPDGRRFLEKIEELEGIIDS